MEWDRTGRGLLPERLEGGRPSRVKKWRKGIEEIEEKRREGKSRRDRKEVGRVLSKS